MEAIGSGPFRVGSLVWQSRPGAFVFSVICKVTFDLRPGVAKLSESPSPVVPFDVLQPGPRAAAGDRAGASLSAASDLVPFKVSPEVLVTGHAYCPGGRPAPQLLVRVAVSGGGKALSVHGDRYFSPSGELSESVPFTRMPLVWERAAGGPDTVNPAGVVTGGAAVPDASGRALVPNLLSIARFFPARSEVLAPVGLGPIAPLWPGRRACLKGHAASWDALRWSEKPLPPDMDGAYFQSAPSDQTVSEIAAEERIYLENLHPEVAQLTTRLPRLAPRAVAELGGATSPLALRCDTLAIDTDRATATLTYRGSVPIDHPHREGRVIVTEEPNRAAAAVPAQIGPPAPPAAPAPPPAAAPPESPPPAQAMTALPLGDAPRAALPFEPPSTEMAAMLAALPPDLRDRMAARLARLGDLSAVSVSGTTLPISSSKPVLPFSGDAGHDDTDDDGDTQRPPPPDAQAPPALASPAAPPAPAAPTLAFVVPAAWKSAGFSVTETLALPHLAASAEPPAELPEPAVLAEPRAVRFAPAPPPEDEPAARPAAAPLPEPPPMLGPLARPAEEPSAAESSPPSPAADSASPAAEPLPTIDDYPLERYARIEASLGLCDVESAAPDRRSRAEVLEAHGLTPAGFEHLRSLHRGRIDEQARRGKSLLARAYDASYVATVEAERGPLTEAEYVEIVIALDAGAAEETLARLSLPKDAAMPIRRRWIARMAADPRLAARIRRAIAEERAR